MISQATSQVLPKRLVSFSERVSGIARSANIDLTSTLTSTGKLMGKRQFTASLAMFALLTGVQIGLANSAVAAEVTLRADSTSVSPGESVELTLEGCGTGPINYTWMSEGVLGETGFDQSVENTYRLPVPEDFSADQFTVDAECWIEAPFGGDRDVLGNASVSIDVEAPEAETPDVEDPDLEEPAPGAITITTNTAGTKRIGLDTYVWGSVANAQPGDKVVTQVQLPNGSWSQSQAGELRENLGYVLPLTYGADVIGTYTYRVAVATAEGRIAVSEPFTLTRTPTLTVSHVDTKRIDEATFAWGSYRGGNPGDRVVTQVMVNGAWSQSQAVTLQDNLGYVIELTYGRDVVGLYTYRVVVVSDGEFIVSEPFQLRRVN